MTAITPVTTSPTTTPASAAPSGGFAGGDFETFLKMLTTQIKNQDPMNPMESTDFAVQLATFSGVEQQVRTNDLLQSLGRQLGVSGLAQLSGWIGKEARTSGPVWFGAQPITLNVAPDPRADSVVLVTMKDGVEVSREEIGPGQGDVDWFGRNTSDAKLPDGLYSFRTESWQGGQKISDQPVTSFARVTEAQMTERGLVLVFPGGATALADEVSALRDPA
ncbi:MAG: flagellar hook capping FlgD N-terminal domain-containing protein [Paracoccus sp. (in: a-proteobacteria)]|nr:flagellar hook capping FlgD N-terminal domain-containing protein [Paracoccus sp. (in: a-proteobacteria)]